LILDVPDRNFQRWSLNVHEHFRNQDRSGRWLVKVATTEAAASVSAGVQEAGGLKNMDIDGQLQLLQRQLYFTNSIWR
jgi:hypothetical protein